jgi:isocitrate dehydrogenase (NAD+)
MSNPTIVILDGDQTGQELLAECLRVIAPDVTGIPVDFLHFDLSLENRRRTKNACVHEAAEAVQKTGFGLKAATITPEQKEDVGSPNAILRAEIGGKVILRTGRRIPGVRPVAGVHAPIAVVRMAVDGAYGAKEWRETSGTDEIAYRTEKLSRNTCRAVAEFSFQYAGRTGAKVFGGPKYTVSPVYEGMFKEELDAAHARHPRIPYEPHLIDATLALLMTSAGDGMVIPTLNRDGDLISDLVLQMFGSIAGSESIILGFDESAMHVNVVLAEAPHGTAPALYGKNIANPMAMILAGAALFGYFRTAEAERVSRIIYESVFEAVYAGVCTADLSGQATTTEFTDEVIQRIRAKREVWSVLG